jgi:hypothetical protein
MWVGGRPSSSGARVGSSCVRRMRMGFSGHGSSSARDTSQGSSFGLGPWLSQSRSINWIHAAASKLSDSAGWNLSRVRSSRLMVRGLGRMSHWWSGCVWSIGTLRPNRVPALPIRGLSRSL